MKAISLWQPWASLIAIGAKRIETRSWGTRYRGPLAIHAAKKRSRELDLLCLDVYGPFRAALLKSGNIKQEGDVDTLSFPVGAIVATATLFGTDVTRAEPRLLGDPDWGIQIPPAEPERSFGDYTPGRFAWILQDIRPLARPIPFKGSQGFFDVPDELIEQARRAS